MVACRRLNGKHTYDVLPAQQEDIHSEYEIRAKIVKTTTDNGTNFVKVFFFFFSENSYENEEPEENCLYEEVFDDLTQAAECFDYQLPTSNTP